MLNRLRSNYSNPPGGSSPEELLQACARAGWKQVVLADSNLCGAYAFSVAAEKVGIRPVYALDVRDASCQVVLIARTRTGYANLCELVSRKNLNQGFLLTRDLPELQNGLTVLCRDIHSLTTLARTVNRRNLYAEVVRPGNLKDERQLCSRARQLGVRAIAGVDVRYTDSSHVPRLNMLMAIRANALLSDILPDAGCYGIPSAEEFRHRFEDMPHALQSLEYVGRQCQVHPWHGRLIFPALPGDAACRLRESAMSGLGTRYATITEPISSRLEYELATVFEMGFAEYFLVVAEIVEYARSLGSPVACRGSGAGSLLAYCLRISNVDPIRYHLPFERFLNAGREDPPDLDIDLCHMVRDDVIRHVFDRYGDRHVAMISTHIALQPRSAIRLCGKALGISDREIKQLQRQFGDGPNGWKHLDRRGAVVLESACNLIGAPHHLSLHPGGIIITPGAIARHTPLIRSPKGVVTSMYDKDGVEAAGLVKIDLLGNRALSAFGESSYLVRTTHEHVIDPEHPAHADAKVLTLLDQGDTLGVNQLESPAMRRLLVQVNAKTPHAIMQALALVRPGASGMGTKQRFIQYARGLEPSPHLDPRIAPVLTESYGLLIYEDDILQLLQALAGMSPAEAQVFRKQLGKSRSVADRKPLAQDFFTRTRQGDIPTHVALEAWTQMSKFNAYSFCRAHAASYGLLAWSSCWLKAHYPQEFWVAALNHNQGMYAPWVYAEAIKQAGIALLPPDINRSETCFTCEPGGIRCGLSRITGLSVAAQRAITMHRPFHSFQDFIHRARMGINELQALIRAGALDGFQLNRPQMLALSTRNRPLVELGQDMPGLFDYHDAEAPVPAMDGFSEVRRFTDEWFYLGLSVRAHPATVTAGCAGDDECISPLTPAMAGNRVVLRGMLAARRRITTENAREMCFITLSDEGGLVEVTLQAEVYTRCRHLLNHAAVLRVEGTVTDHHGSLSLQAEDVAGVQ